MSDLQQIVPLDTSCRAQYEDGFVLDETALNDFNPYGKGNTLTAIINKSAEEHHGKMVKFSVFWQNSEHSVDWTTLPDNARPIRFRDGNLTTDLSSGEQKHWWSGGRFGYQYNDETGKNIQEVEEL